MSDKALRTFEGRKQHLAIIETSIMKISGTNLHLQPGYSDLDDASTSRRGLNYLEVPSEN